MNSVNQVQKGFDEFKNASELAQKSTNEASKKQVDELAEKLGKQLEEMQERQGQLEVSMKRPGAIDAANDNDPQSAEKKAAFKNFLSSTAIEPSAEDRKFMSTDSNVGGGYLVPTQALGIIENRIFESSPVRRVANVVNTTSKSVSMVADDDEAEAKWESEGSPTQGNDTDTPDLGTIEITAHKLTAQPKMTTELIEDAAFDVEGWLQGKVADAFARKESTGFVLGNGVSMPRGFLTYANVTTPGAYQRNAIEQILNGGSSVSVDGLIDLQGNLKEAYQPRATFGMKRSTLTAYMKLKGTDMYRFLNLQPAVGPQGQVIGATLTLMEKPVVLMDDMPAVAANSLAVAYGDFSRAYTIVNRRGITVLKDPYTAKGFMRYFTTKRVGGGVTNFEAIKLLKLA